MREVKLDFVRHENGNLLFGGFVLAIGLATAVGASYFLNGIEAERTRLEGRLWQLRSPAATTGKGDAALLNAADRLTAQFQRPWDRLFVGLEGIKLKGLRLNQILPQTGEGNRVQLSGEVDEAETLYEYMRRLRGGDLHDVHLLQQRWDEKSQLTQFRILATWNDSASVPGKP
jgi:hypothetical protein